MSAIAERVARGAALLDEKIPGWDKRIDLKTLNLGSCTECIVGQTRFYEVGYDSAYGFDIIFEDERRGPAAPHLYDDLTAAWRELIESRRAGPGASPLERTLGRAVMSTGRWTAVTSPNAPRPADPLTLEIADMLRRIEINYGREGSGPGSRFEGCLLEDVQAEAVMRMWPR